MSSNPLSLSVVIPTYGRPEWIRRAVASLAAQDPTPDQVIAVARDTDVATHEAIARLQAASLPFALLRGTVREPGFLPPVREGIRLATGDVIAVMDDDAEATPGWTHGLLRNYSSPSVGGVGGRYINMLGETEADVPQTDRVGYVSFVGHFVGDMYKRPTFSSPVDVQFLLGGCMSYRREVAKALEIDFGLNNNVAFGYETDLGLQVRAMGLRLLFDPAVAVRHYSAPRNISGMRSPNDSESVRWCAYNETRIALRRLPLLRAVLVFLWSTILGTRRAPGLLPWLVAPLARRLAFIPEVAPAALAGRFAGLRGVRRDGRAERSGTAKILGTWTRRAK